VEVSEEDLAGHKVAGQCGRRGCELARSALSLKLVNLPYVVYGRIDQQVGTGGDDMRGRVRAIAALLIVTGYASAGCGQQHSRRAVISVDAPTALADQPVHVKISGLAPRDTVSVSAASVDHLHKQWRGQAAFRADSRGAVVLDRARPISGTYTGVDGMGLFWSMEPLTGNFAEGGFVPRYPDLQSAYTVQITVTAHGRRLAGRTLTRQWLNAGVTHKTFTVATDNVSGEVYLPPAGTGRHPAVLLFGGSEGGNTGSFDAALLASHGYPALTLAYFGEPGLPTTLHNISLGYFARAARLLAAQPGADPARLVARGYSRGSEAALLLGQYYPGLIHGVIVYSPSEMVNQGFPDAGVAWTDNGRPIAQGTIPLDHISGPVLVIAGTKDLLWSSAPSARHIITELDLDHDRFPHQALTYEGAGHGVGTFPYLAAVTQVRHPVTGRLIDLGGSRGADAAAKEQGWPKTLAFVASIGR
jgi:dienelactone hydrolase